ncbi:MAG: type II toxin-antitoxin system VapC family toxin [Bacteroidetes bacterium]|nr:type II toxin-antitoxin system VapC family toxin [Bacteroidota bacterium]MCL5738664.1 type II toxin-antitoxin system VapC family toxin [Bacteroidota bacterium]
MKTTVLDSYAVISYLQQQEGYQEVATIFDECAAKDREVFLSIINWGEVIYQAIRRGGETRAKLAEDAMAALPIQLVEANKELTHQAAVLKASNKMSYADCFAAALAVKKKGELVTGDSEFKQVEKQVKVRWIK